MPLFLAALPGVTAVTDTAFFSLAPDWVCEVLSPSTERIDRGRPISFTFDGKAIPAYEGDTIASALYASGRRTFSRSFKYHRPRGELCGCGQCANSLVQIGGRPAVRACAEPASVGVGSDRVGVLMGHRPPIIASSDPPKKSARPGAGIEGRAPHERGLLAGPQSRGAAPGVGEHSEKRAVKVL